MGVERLLSDEVSEPYTFENRSLELADSDDVYEALSSETSSQILQLPAETSGTISERAADADSSVTNVNSHVDRFERVGLVDGV